MLGGLGGPETLNFIKYGSAAKVLLRPNVLPPRKIAITSRADNMETSILFMIASFPFSGLLI
jgi:hypothetical protein